MSTEPRTTPADKARGDAILATMQAQRAYRAETDPSDRSAFDEAHAIVGRLLEDGYIALAAPDSAELAAAKLRHPAGKAAA